MCPSRFSLSGSTSSYDNKSVNHERAKTEFFFGCRPSSVSMLIDAGHLIHLSKKWNPSLVIRTLSSLSMRFAIKLIAASITSADVSSQLCSRANLYFRPDRKRSIRSNRSSDDGTP